MDTFIKVFKVVVVLLVAGGSIVLVGDLVGLLNTSLIVAALSEIAAINLPLTLLTTYPNFWLLMGYLIFKGILVWTIDFFKRSKK
jgi:hypothetical protein